MESKLNVEIGAQLTNLNKSFAQAIQVVTAGSQQMDNAVSKTEKQFQILNNTKFTFGQNYVTASKKLAVEAMHTGAALGGSLKKGANEAGFALTNLGRVAQDAPFGFIGIQNNLNPLLESFARLKAETGSSGAALKALGSSLIGPAGLGIALSVVSAAILFYQQYARSAKKEIIDLATANDVLSDAIKKGNTAAGKEISNLELLYNAATNVKNAQGTRNKAAEEVIRLSEGVFKATDKEKLKNGELEGAYNTLTQSIIANARAKAIADKIGEQEAIILDAQIKRKKIEIANLNENAKTKDVRSDVGMGQSTTYTTDQQISANNKRTKIELENQDKIVRGAEKVQALLKSFTNDKSLVDALVPTEKIKNYTEKAEKAKKVTQEWLDLMWAKGRDKSVSGLSTETNLPKGGDMQAEITKKAQASGLEQLKKGEKEYLENVDKFNQDVITLMNTGLVTGFSGIGEAIGGALASGENVLEAFGKSIFSTVGDVLVQFGKMTIAAGVAALALKSALKLGNPFAAIAAGVALVAIGSLVKGGSSNNGNQESQTQQPRKIPGFANGVNDFRGGLAVVGERGPELVNLPTGSSVIPNHNISAMGGGNIIFNVSTRIDSLGNLITSIDRERLRLKRVGA